MENQPLSALVVDRHGNGVAQLEDLIEQTCPDIEVMLVRSVAAATRLMTASSFDVVHPEDRQRVVGLIEACVSSGTEYQIEHRVVGPDGAVRWIAGVGALERASDGEAVRLVDLVWDITSRRTP
jgi:PAS domain-containing protein